MLPALFGRIGSEEALLLVSGDGAYDTIDCHEAIALRDTLSVRMALFRVRLSPVDGR